jgi:hypothetical protein
MKFKVTYTTVREFEIPEGATDEEYDAMKEVILAGIQDTKIEPDNVKVERIDVPAEPAPEYKINKDCD